MSRISAAAAEAADGSSTRDQASDSAPKSPGGADARRFRPSRFRLTSIFAALVGAWALPLVCQFLGTQWIALVAVIGFAACMLSGGTVLDRLVVAMTVILAAALPIGVLLSLWPWHLAPVALGGTALTLLVVLGLATGRRPALPARLTVRGEWTVLGATAATAVLFCWPFLNGNLTDRLALVIRSEDLARHFIMYDAARRVGGYLFLHEAAATETVLGIDTTYPPGAYLATALLDNFVTSQTTPGGPFDAMNRFIWYDLSLLIFLCLVTLWAARRIAGPAASAPGLLPVAATVVGYLFFSATFGAFLFGFMPELLGLTLLAVFIAIAARPLPSTREQLVVLTALAGGISFVYYFLLPVVAAVGMAWAWTARRRLQRHWPLVVIATLFLVPACLGPRYINSDEHGWRFLLLQFGVVRVDLGPVLALGLVVLAGGLLTRSWWRTPAMRVLGAAVVAATGMTVAIGLIQLYKIKTTAYFFDKSMHTTVVVLLVALGALTPAIGRLVTITGARAPAVVAAILLAATPLAALGAIPGPSLGRSFLDGSLSIPAPADTTIRVARGVPDASGKFTLIYTGSPEDHYATWYTSALQRDLGHHFEAYVWTLGSRSPADVVAFVGDQAGRREVQVVSSDDQALTLLRDLQRRRPDIGLEVIDLRTLPGA